MPYEEPRTIGRVERPRLEEGWSSVALLAVMLAAVAMAIDDSRWVGNGPHGDSQTGFLVFAILLGAAWGVISAKSRLPAPLAHFGGALLAAPFLILAAAASISLGSTPAARVSDLILSFDRFYVDLVVRGVRSSETGPFLLSIGAIAWATGQFAAFAVFRRHRPLTAIFTAGFALIANIAITLRPQYPFLVIFAAAALLLLVRMNILEQSEGWLRRRIGDAEVKALFLRGGLAFVAAAVLGTTVLTATAASAPLEGAWDDFDETIVDVAQQFNSVIGGVTGPARGPSGLFGDSQTISGFFQGSSELIFTAVASDAEPRKWRAATYDAWSGDTWSRTKPLPGDRIEPGTAVLSGTREPVDETTAGRVPVMYTITSVDLPRNMVVTPDAPFTMDRPVTVFTNEGNGPLTGIEFADGIRDGQSYTLQALVRTEDEEAGLTEERLRAAGVVYPDWTERYVAIQEGSIGDVTRATAKRIVADLSAERRTPFDIAKAIQNYLYRDGGFEYQEDVRGLCGGDEPLIDCFLQTKLGYCEHYAAAMAMLLRASGDRDGQGIPARVAMGFLPGKPLSNGVWQVDRGAAHAWVEVYFPRYGWVEFDPTPGNEANGQQPTTLPVGEPVATPTPAGSLDPGSEFRPSPSFVRGVDAGGSPRPTGGAAVNTTTNGPQGPIPPVLVLVVAGLVIAAVAAGTWTRSLRAPAPEPEAVYRGVARLAGRFGYGPSPTQTAYEYAGTLGEIVPTVRGELQTVARAKVEATYAARPPQGDALYALRDAYRRLRVNLLRLAFRRHRR